MDELITTTQNLEDTSRLKSSLGTRVLTKKGIVIGKVSQIRFNPKNFTVEGFVVSRGLFRKPVYIDRTFIEHLSPDAIILTIEPIVLLKGKRVITYEGKVVGKVRRVNRIEKTNAIISVVVKPLLRKEFAVTIKNIHSFGASVILKEGYDVPKTPFW